MNPFTILLLILTKPAIAKLNKNNNNMGSLKKEVDREVLPFYRVYKDGSVERLQGSTPYVPTHIDDPTTGVSSKDITLSENPLIRARLHLPNAHLESPEKLPVLVYFHGGGFCIESAFSHTEHQLLTSLTAQAQCLAVSIDYRLAPEHPLPAAYDDCWYGLQWVVSHLLTPEDKNSQFAPDPWVTEHADFDRLFIGGDSAGANIAHNVVMRFAADELSGRVNILGMFITHPYFWGSKAVGSEKQAELEKDLGTTLWHEVYPSAPDGIDNPFINPFADKAPSLATLPCKRLLVGVAKEDGLVNRGVFYYETVKKSGWKGQVELIEVEGEGHAFHIVNYETDNAKTMINRLATFLGTQEIKSIHKEVATEVLPFYRVYKDGSIERLLGSTPYVPTRIDDLITGVSSKDITISENPLIRARLHIPNGYLKSAEKLPVLVYCHGGGFCIESAFSDTEHRLLTSLVAEAQCLAVSIDYRLAPEHPLPAAYEDCWYGLRWVVSHYPLTLEDRQAAGLDHDPWITEHADFDRLYVGGDSAGANIAHNIVMRAATEELLSGRVRVKILGMFITHPYFWGPKAVGSEKQAELEKDLGTTLWHEVYPSAPDGIDNPFINPFADKAPSLATLPCKRLLIGVAKEDGLVNRGVFYYETVKKSGWKGQVELIEVEGEGHAFHIVNYETDNAKIMIKRLATFLSN